MLFAQGVARTSAGITISMILNEVLLVTGAPSMVILAFDGRAKETYEGRHSADPCDYPLQALRAEFCMRSKSTDVR